MDNSELITTRYISGQQVVLTNFNIPMFMFEEMWDELCGYMIDNKLNFEDCGFKIEIRAVKKEKEELE